MTGNVLLQIVSTQYLNYWLIFLAFILCTAYIVDMMILNVFMHFLQNPQADHCRLQEVGTYCQESRRLDQWVPELVLQER